MTKSYILVDGNSLGNFANGARKLSIGDMPVQAIYGFLRTLHKTCATFAFSQPIVLWDGLSWRKKHFSDYKSNRDRVETKHEIRMAEERALYHRQKPHIQRALTHLGIPQVIANNMEADDLGAIMADRYAAQGAQVILFTGDKDWIQLVGPKVVWFDFANNRKITHKTFEEMTGVSTIRQFVEVKALSGDQGDGIPGVGGLGEKGAKDFLAQYGSFNSFFEQVTFGEIKLDGLPKKIRALVEDETKALIFSRNLELMDLRTPARPKPEGLVIEKGTPSVDAFRDFCEDFMFRSFLQDLELWISVFPAFKHQSPLTNGATVA